MTYSKEIYSSSLGIHNMMGAKGSRETLEQLGRNLRKIFKGFERFT